MISKDRNDCNNVMCTHLKIHNCATILCGHGWHTSLGMLLPIGTSSHTFLSWVQYFFLCCLWHSCPISNNSQTQEAASLLSLRFTPTQEKGIETKLAVDRIFADLGYVQFTLFLLISDQISLDHINKFKLFLFWKTYYYCCYYHDYYDY